MVIIQRRIVLKSEFLDNLWVWCLSIGGDYRGDLLLRGVKHVLFGGMFGH